MKRLATPLLLSVLLLSGCVAQKSFRRAELEARRENWDKAVIEYSKAIAEDPGNTRYKIALERAKLKASAQHFQTGKRYAAAAQWDLAVAEFQQTLLLNSGNQHAQNELDHAMREIRRRDAGPSEIQTLKEKARRKALAPPRLSPKSNITMGVTFKDQPPTKIYEAMSKASGINFLFDEKVATDTKPITIDVGNVTLEEALDLLMLQTKSFYKVINENTLLIAPDNRQKRQEYEDQVIRTFYLSNGDTKQVVTLLRSLINSRQIAENPALNSVSIKDTPDKVAIAEKIINANDKSKGEIVVDVELLEINRALVQNLGVDLSNKRISLTFQDGETSLPLNNLKVLKQQGNWFLGPIPSVVLDFLRTDSDSKTIAKPSVRVSEGEKAEILIGDRVPIPTTSFNTSQTVGGNIVPITSFTYQNVGITVQIEPRVHHNKEVTLKVQVEVSQIAGNVRSGGAGGQDQPIIGTRTIQTVIRLKDGETNMLAGLIRREDQDARAGVAGIMSIPGVGKLLSQNASRRNETDIVMTLTPYIVRIPDITEDDLTELWVGTEDNMALRGPARKGLAAGPFAREEEEPAAAAPLEGGETAPVAPGAQTTPERPGSVGISRPTDQTGVPAPVPSEEVVPPPGEEAPPPPEDAGAPDQGNEPQPTSPTGPAVVRLVPSAPTYKVGETVTVEVRLENGANVGSVPFHLRYNRNVLEFLSPGEQGPFLGSDGTNTVFMAQDAQGGGEIIVGNSRMGSAEGVTGSGPLCVFRFQAVNPGDAGFAFTGASVKDPQTRNLPATFASAAVTVEP
ncbi:MAG TPA: secretin N-terminal domain-containing protein [Candidatus Polarisedimenticolaceae bacterium]|nr:secretin N-terminal domain-containing protein [Candidatus Polarisedimenticolaceae bacterium]